MLFGEKKIELLGKRVTVVGAARSGLGAIELLWRLGAHARLSDHKSQDQCQEMLQRLSRRNELESEWGGHTEAFIKESDLIVMSPGVPREARPWQWAAQEGISVISEIELAYRCCQNPIIAVTGSNGKTTTATLIAALLKAQGIPVSLCGNIGRPFSLDVLDLTPEHWVVLEISSFQLQSTTTFRPKIAVWTNFSQNHLDRHKDLQEYFDAKARLVLEQGPDDIAILNAQQPELVALAKTLKSQVRFFNTPEDEKKYPHANAASLACVAAVLGIPSGVVDQVIKEFKGVEHRLEFVRQYAGVDYINDSKSTTVEAGRWALERMQKPVVLICGGLDKHLDYRPLRDLVKFKVKAMVAIGQARIIMQETFGDVVAVDAFLDFPQALTRAKVLAKEGDCILLSPMCASFDMFKDYEHRGRMFKEWVMSL